MIRRLVVIALLTGVWIALWGNVSIANLVSGVLVAQLTLIAVPLDRPDQRGAARLGGALRFGAYFAKALVVANLEVAWEVVTPRNRDNEGIVALPVAPSCSPTLLMLIVNAIGLTPGTVVVEITDEPRTLYVHVLHLDDVEETRAELLELQRRALAAFGSAGAVAELDSLAATWRERSN